MDSRRDTEKTVVLDRCPACDAQSRDPSWALSREHLQLWRCRSCGVMYSDPQPREEVRRRYLHDYDLGDHFGAVAARKRVLFERRLDRLPTPGTLGTALCDVGSGDGLFLELAAERGWEGVGIELNPPAVRRARSRGLDVIEGPVEDLAHLPQEHFDLVTAWDAIEHTPEPRRFARRLAQLVTPGGVVAVSTLNRRSAVAAVFRSRWSMVAADHFTLWDRGSLGRLLESVGLSVEAVRYYGLGRDFFCLVDRAWNVRTRAREADGRLDWTTGAGVLAAEDLVNRVLNATHAGVEIEVIAQRSGRRRGSAKDRG
jgi:2-polyprenyl-3-methyl-5-hydroxy-6-metoxy-1,4-benzoquinol methylase